MFQTLAGYYRTLVLGHPKSVLVLVFIAVLAAAAGLPNFKLDASSDSLTLEHDEDLDYFRQVNKRYQAGDFLIVTYRPKVDLFSDAAIQTLLDLRRELTGIPGVVGSLSMLDAPLLYSPKVALTEIDAPRTLLTPGIDRKLAKKEFLNSPIYRQMLLGPDGQTTAMMLNLRVDNTYIELVRRRDALRLQRDEAGLTDSEAQELQQVTQEFRDYHTEVSAENHRRVEMVREIIGRYKDRAEIFVGGATMITADMISFIQSDLKVFGLGVLAFIIVILAIIFRQVRFVVLPMVTCLSSVVIMLGFLSWIDWRLTVISSNFVPLLLIITLAITIHLQVRYREYHGADPDATQDDLVWKTVRFMAKPCLYTTLTTMVAFVSLVVSDIRPVIDFGWMMTIGLVLSLVLSFLVIPAGMMALGKAPVRGGEDNSHAFTTRFSRFTEHHPTLVLVASVALGVISAFGISRLEVENRFIDYFHDSTEIYQGMLVIDRNLGGTINLDILLQEPGAQQTDDSDYANGVQGEAADSEFSDPFGSDDPFGAGDPFAVDEASGLNGDPFAADDDPFSEGDPFGIEDHAMEQPYWFTVAGLEEINRLQEYLESLPEVGKVQSLAIAYQVGKDISGGSLNDFELALMLNALPREIADVLISPYLSAENGEARITLRAMDSSPELRRQELLEKIRKYLVNDMEFAPDRVNLSGLLVLYSNMLQSLYSSQILTIGAVFLGIVLMFLVLFRSLVLALIAVTPNLLAAACVLGGMGVTGVPLDMMTITIAAITVGIGVDFSIHYLYRFRQEYAERKDYIAAMHQSHASIGMAMFYTSIIIILGFSILSLSKFIPTIYFGLLTGAAMLAAILAALTLLPRLILLIKPL